MSICKDCFHSYVCEQFNEHRECDNKKCHFANDHFISADLINRLQAENERLKKLLEQCEDNGEYWESKYKTAKAEAYKEFAERLKNEIYQTFFGEPVITEEDIDNLLKEMVGEDYEKTT